jgi:2-octaprenyl-6-methoxyphenol hydroxylase
VSGPGQRADAVVVGGGLGGLATALGLARSGCRVTVVERSAAPRVDAWGLLLWPPGTRCLEWLGVLDEVLAAGSRLSAFEWFTTDGRTNLAIDLANLGAGVFLGVLPSRLDGILRRAAEAHGVEVRDGVGDWSAEHDGSSWAVTLQAEGGPSVVTAPLLIGADGASSRVREFLGLAASRWQPRSQVIVSGVGGPAGLAGSRQGMGPRSSGGCVALGEQSWLYVVTGDRNPDEPAAIIADYGRTDPATSVALPGLGRAVRVRPTSIRTPRWAVDHALVMGDAAHAMVPHFGLGGTLTLEDVPVLVEVVQRALAGGDTSLAVLSEFQRRRARRIAYATRVSNRWASLMTSVMPGVRRGRDLGLAWLASRPERLATYYRELASSDEVPPLGVRLRALLP